MKKTVISIALLFAVSIPILHYGQTSKTTLSAQKKENLISQILFGERKTGLKPATLSLEG